MKYAFRHLFTDFLAALLFLAVYVTTGNVAAGAAVAIVAGLAQAAFQIVTGRRIDPMQWLSLGIILVLSAASIATNSPRFVMLKRGWLLRYLPQIARENLPQAVPIAAGYAWAGLMLALGVTNIAVALYADFATWAWFVSVGLVSAKFGAFALQYVVFRTIIARRIRAAAVAAVLPVAAA